MPTQYCIYFCEESTLTIVKIKSFNNIKRIYGKINKNKVKSKIYNHQLKM